MPNSVQTDVLTILYTDVEHSTLESQRHGDAWDESIQQMHRMSRELIDQCDGSYAMNTGDGFVALFAAPLSAVQCACDLQRAMHSSEYGDDKPHPKMRIGVHTDTPKVIDGHYCGFAMSRAHRIMDAAHGGQILLSGSTYELIRQNLAADGDLISEPLG